MLRQLTYYRFLLRHKGANTPLALPPGLLTLSRVPLTDLYSLLTPSFAAEWRRTLSPLGTQKKLQCLYLSAIIYAGTAAHTRPPYREFPPLARNNFPTLFPLIPWPSLTNPAPKRTLE